MLAQRIDWNIDSRGRYTALIFGKVLRRAPSVRERSKVGGNWIHPDDWPVRYFKTKEAALAAGEKHIRMCLATSLLTLPDAR